MSKLAALDMLRVELRKSPPLDRVKPSCIDRRKNSKIFEYCMAYLFDLVVWERLPKIPPGSRRYDALGSTPDYGVDCCSLDYSQCLQAKWYGDLSTVTWAHISKFFTMSTVVGAQKRILAIRTGGKIHGVARKLMTTLPITLEWVTDESIDEICALAERRSSALTTDANNASVINAAGAPNTKLSSPTTNDNDGICGSNTDDSFDTISPLRAWQAAALVVLSAALDNVSDSKPVYASIACGGGKSRLCIEMAKTRLPCLVFVPARALASQFATEISRWAPNSSCAIVDGTHTLPTILPDFTICTYHSCDKVAHLKFNLCIVDEAHHAQAEFAGLETSRRYANSMKTVVRQHTLLVSATILSEDDIAYTYSLADAVADGVVVDYHLVIPVFDAGDSRPGLCRLIYEHPEWSKILAYCNTIETAKEFTEMLLEAEIQAQWIEGATLISEREAVIGSLQDGDIRVLVSVYTLGEGINIPKANTAMFVQPRGSSVDVMQCVGRVLRTSLGKTLSYVILPSANEEKELMRFMRLLQRADSRLAVDSQGRFTHDRVSLISSNKKVEVAELQCVAVYNRLGQALRGEWNTTCDLLRDYVAEHDKLPPSNNGVYRGVDLGRWISNQRHAKKGNKGGHQMTLERAAALEAVPGWYWEQDTDKAWSSTYDLLCDYVAKHDRLPPVNTKNGVYRGINLGTWIGSQRQAKKGNGTCKITHERMVALEAVPGWYWDLDEAWSSTCDLLRDYVAEYNRLPSPGKNGVYRGINLGAWIGNQRKAKKSGTLVLERVAALEAIPGWYWDIDEAWNTTCDLLRDYVVEHGKLPPKSGKNGIFRGINLGAWIGTQRRAKKGLGLGKITLERMATLETIPGWYWEQDLDEVWNTTCNLLREYVVEYGRLPLQRNDLYHGINLGTWIGRQRQAKKGSKITLERMAALEAVPGWRW